MIKKLLFILIFFSTSLSFGQVLINEYSCSNISGINDAYGQKEDWIELYNTTGTAINLTGWYLSDKATKT